MSDETRPDPKIIIDELRPVNIFPGTPERRCVTCKVALPAACPTDGRFCWPEERADG